MIKNFKEVIAAILPMTVLIVILTFVFAPLEGEDLASFLVGAAIMMIGMTLFVWGRLFHDGSRRSSREIYDQKEKFGCFGQFGVCYRDCDHDCRAFRASFGTTSI